MKKDGKKGQPKLVAARVRLWLRRGKSCRSCCLFCAYYKQCAAEQAK